MKFKVFLINLDESIDRLAFCQKQFAKYGIDFERVEAVSGRDLSSEQIDQFYDRKRNRTSYKKELSIGELGCYLSHRKCWEKIVEEQLDYAVILEDDIIISSVFKDFSMLFEKLYNWDFVRLAFSTRNVPVVQSHSLIDKYNLVYYKKVPINTLAQAVSYEGAKKLLNVTAKVYRPIDADLKHYWEKVVSIPAIYPPLISERANFESQINKMAKKEGRVKGSNALKNIKYVLGYKIKAAYYDRKQVDLKSFVKSI